MKLRHDPYQVFRFSKTPAGLYARQKWLAEAESPQWKADFQETATSLLADQFPDGSWHHATVTTLSHLFGLHLTVRETSARIEAALNWLFEKITLQGNKIRVTCEDELAAAQLHGLPFAAGRQDMLIGAAALFMATIFGRGSDPAVLAFYQWLSAEGVKGNGRWFDRVSSHNIFRAMVVHPRFARDKATALAVEHLAESQTQAGDWNNDGLFYQTVNALAHLDLALAETQLEKAFPRLFENQNTDGTWGRSEQEWNTFLAIHALKNKGLI